jgi:hypothetical protein
MTAAERVNTRITDLLIASLNAFPPSSLGRHATRQLRNAITVFSNVISRAEKARLRVTKSWDPASGSLVISKGPGICKGVEVEGSV